MTVLHRIEMNVIQVTREVHFVARRTLSMRRCQNSALALTRAARRNALA
jgi:hypothetical protein